MRSECSIEGCLNVSDARGWCKSHYGRWKRHGDPLVLRYTMTCRVCREPYGERGYAHGGTCSNKCQARYHRARRYGMTIEELDVFEEAHNHRCDICGAEGHLDIDHDHSCCPGIESCGACVRGLLCRSCNNKIERRPDDPLVAAYLAS
jgi:hypothetical protein